MKVMDFLNKKAVTAGLKAKDKKGVINELIDLLINAGVIKPRDKEPLLKIILERESLGSTGIGQGVGIPHGKYPDIKEMVAALGISKEGVDFDSLDGKTTHIFFLLIAPGEPTGPHLKALARISRLLKDKYFRDMLKNANDEKELIKIISDEDQKGINR